MVLETQSVIAPGAMSIVDAARYLSISRAYLYELIKAGEIVPAKVGRRTLIRRVDADELLKRSIDAPIPSDISRHFSPAASALDIFA